MLDLNLILFGVVFWVALSLFLLSLFNPKTKLSNPKDSLIFPQVEDSPENKQEIIALKEQVARLESELQKQSQQQQQQDFQEISFELLQSLLTNYPTACKMAETKPDLPAKNLVALFKPLENLLESWGCQPIGQPWQQVNYNPQYHQADSNEILLGELVYIRFVGYQQGDKILVPAKVSLTLPPGISENN